MIKKSIKDKLFLKYIRKSLHFCLLMCIIFLYIAPTSGINNSGYSTISKLQYTNNTKDLYLLRVEHVIYLKANDDTHPFTLNYSCPPVYNFQTPIHLEIFNDSSPAILDYSIEDDKNDPNKVISFFIDTLEQGEIILIHFSIWVLVKNNDYSDLPSDIPFPIKNELPDETKKWLTDTKVVQSDSLLIKLTAAQLRKDHQNLVDFAHEIARYVKEHRYQLFVLQLNLRVFFSQDAITTFFINGENVGRSHLGCGLFRANIVPARVILALPDQTFWTQMHYMFEYYCPNYGWLLVDPTRGKTPFEPRRQVINRICYPEDENNTKTDYIYPLMKGEERWLWISTDTIIPYYIDCVQGSRSKMFTENSVYTDEFIANTIFFLTKKVFYQYEKFLKIDLTGTNAQHFMNGTQYQKQAIEIFTNTFDLLIGYTPESNAGAIRFVKMCGAKILGTVPNLIWNEEKQMSEPGVISFYRRKTDENI